jgi:acid phosphatase class B
MKPTSSAKVLTHRQRSWKIWDTTIEYLEHFKYDVTQVEDHASNRTWIQVARHFTDSNCVSFSSDIFQYLRRKLGWDKQVYLTNSVLWSLLNKHLKAANEVYYSDVEEED